MSVLLQDIWVDPTFNCRSFSTQLLKDLADSIHEVGLIQPVVVQPIADVIGYEGACKYRLIAGFRRHRAVSLFLKWGEIPAVVKTGLTDEQARLINFTENLERKDMTLQEEAHWLDELSERISVHRIAKQVSRSDEWVTRRLRFAKMPEWVQEHVLAGDIKLHELKELESHEPEDWQRIIGLTIKARHLKRPGGLKGTDHKRRVKNKHQIARMMRNLVSIGVTGPALNFGAWCLGKMTDERLVEVLGKRRQTGFGELFGVVRREALKVVVWYRSNEPKRAISKAINSLGNALSDLYVIYPKRGNDEH